MASVKTVAIEEISMDPRLQMRAEMDKATIADYAEILDRLPPVKLILEEDNAKYLLFDGWHTIAAAEKKGRKKVKAEITEGTWLDAFIGAAGANIGLRRSNADKRRAVESVIKENATGGHGWTQPQIAEMTGVSTQFVSKVANYENDETCFVKVEKCDLCGVFKGMSHVWGCARVLHPADNGQAGSEVTVTSLPDTTTPTQPTPDPVPKAVTSKPVPPPPAPKPAEPIRPFDVLLCRRCQDEGRELGCVQCKKLRMNGTPQAPPATRPPAPPPGTPSRLFEFDWPALWLEFDSFTQSIERLVKTCPGEEDGDDHRRAKYLIDGLRVLMTQWQKRLDRKAGVK